MGKLKIISTQKIEVMRELAYADRTPELANTNAVVMSGSSLMRVNTLNPVTYKFEKGSNEIDDPITFRDPVTRKEITESILTWKGVQHLIKIGVFEAFNETGEITPDKIDKANAKAVRASKKAAEKVETATPKTKKSLADVASQ